MHAAVSCGAVNASQVLLLESDVDFMAVNKRLNFFSLNKLKNSTFICFLKFRKQNIMHLCAINIGIISAEVFLTILEVHPKYPLEAQDMYGNTCKLYLIIYSKKIVSIF